MGEYIFGCDLITLPFGWTRSRDRRGSRGLVVAPPSGSPSYRLISVVARYDR